MAIAVSGYTPPSGYTTNQQIRDLQTQLNAQGANLNVDGVWGPKTQAAYAQYGNSAAPSYSVTIPQQYTDYLTQFQNALTASIPTISYSGPSRAELQADIEAALRPGYDLAIAQRKKQTDTNKAELDADAAARGMGSSTWVTDVKNRQQNAEATDIATLEGKYASSLAEQLMQALAQERANQLAVDQYNSGLKASALQSALGLAGDFYNNYLAQQQSSSRGRSSGGGDSAGIQDNLNEVYEAPSGNMVVKVGDEWMLESYLQKQIDNGTVKKHTNADGTKYYYK